MNGDVDILGALEKLVGRTLPEPVKPRHPETGCRCADCWRRDSNLEAVAEDLAMARRLGDY